MREYGVVSGYMITENRLITDHDLTLNLFDIK